MSVIDEVTAFANELSPTTGVRTELATFPSGAVWLDVFVGGRHFILAYLPSYSSFGVDEVQPDEGLGTTFRFGFPDFASAKQKLLTLLRQAPAVVPSHQ